MMCELVLSCSYGTRCFRVDDSTSIVLVTCTAYIIFTICWLLIENRQHILFGLYFGSLDASGFSLSLLDQCDILEPNYTGPRMVKPIYDQLTMNKLKCPQMQLSFLLMFLIHQGLCVFNTFDP